MRKVAGAVIAEQWSYGFDAAWNLKERTNGTSIRTSYTVDSKNQLTNPGSPTYDSNGNMTFKDGFITYVYDDENRLVEVADNVYMSFKTDFTYDGMGRMRIRDESLSATDPDTGTNYWYTASQTRFIYDGWRVIQERDGGNTPTVSYTRGNDLSGTLEGAGGIGGMLARSHGHSGGNWSTHNYYHADGNGNITYLIDGSQAMAAAYRYNDPYGYTVTASGSLAGANLYRFSSKYLYQNSSLSMYYYGYRFYDPYLQRWLNRDPIGDSGFQRLNFSLEHFNAGKSEAPAYLLTLLLPRLLALHQIEFRKLRDLFVEATATYLAIIAEAGAGDANLYRASGNNPISIADPDGLTGWQFTDPFGSFQLPTSPFASRNPR